MINKVLVINSSLNGNAVITGKMSQAFINGILAQNAEVDVVNITGMNINSCRGCTEDLCFESSGKCQIQDDMQTILPRLVDSDIWVIATSVKDNSIHINLRNLIDRLEPLYEPAFNMLNGTSSKKAGKIVLLACSSDSGTEVFNEIINDIKSVSVLLGRDFAGAILRPHTRALSALDYFSNFSENIYSNITLAGEELIRNGKISRNTILNISSELTTKNSFISQVEKEFIPVN